MRLLKTLFKTIRIGEGKIDCLWRITIESERKGDIKSIRSIVKDDVLRNSLPSLLSWRKNSIYWLQSSFVQFALVIHLSHWKCDSFTLLSSLDIEVEPSTEVSCCGIGQGIFWYVDVIEILRNLDALCHVSWIKTTWECQMVINKCVLLRVWVPENGLWRPHCTLWLRSFRTCVVIRFHNQ